MTRPRVSVVILSNFFSCQVSIQGPRKLIAQVTSCATILWKQSLGVYLGLRLGRQGRGVLSTAKYSMTLPLIHQVHALKTWLWKASRLPLENLNITIEKPNFHSINQYPVTPEFGPPSWLF